ncbi:peptidylprolyl isomerase [Winogradskyella litorisediminis]|uniref:Peptidylprolyl isomerase n=1 Tax=Winogradskyella litorisediminis TaxID=1156618 RepID=A0ABW3N219_9FLAO
MNFAYLFIFLFSITAFSQRDYKSMLERVNSESQAKIFIKRFQADVNGEIISLNPSDILYKNLKLSEAPIGDTKVENSIAGKITYKVLDKSKSKSSKYRASIMEFDSNKLPISEINSLRAFILQGLKNKEHKFENLARVYSSHPTAKTGGDLGWTAQGTFSSRFEKAIADKSVGQAFSFDEHRKKKHYIIVKTEENKTMETVKILKVTEIK